MIIEFHLVVQAYGGRQPIDLILELDFARLRCRRRLQGGSQLRGQLAYGRKLLLVDEMDDLRAQGADSRARRGLLEVVVRSSVSLEARSGGDERHAAFW